MEKLHDLAKISYAINGYEKNRGGKYSKEYHCDTVELQKKLGDRYYYVVEAAPSAKNKTLHVVSAYINKNDTFSEVAVSNDPSRYVRDEPQSNESFSNNIIPQTSKNVTKKYSIDIDIEAEIASYGVETKFNDYIGMQKGVVSTLKEEGFFDSNVVTNEET